VQQQKYVLKMIVFAVSTIKLFITSQILHISTSSWNTLFFFYFILEQLKLKKITHRLAHRLAVRQFVSESTRVQYLQQELEGGRKATCCQRLSRRKRMLNAWRCVLCVFFKYVLFWLSLPSNIFIYMSISYIYIYHYFWKHMFLKSLFWLP